MYRCTATKFHMTVSGRAIDDEHFCEEGNVSLAVQKHLRITRHLWDSIAWQCPNCESILTGEKTCSQCPSASGRAVVLQSKLFWFAETMATLTEPTVPTKTLCLETLTDIILSPHGVHLAGLLPGAYSSTNIPASANCSCTREGGQGLDWHSREPPEACPGSASGRKMDGSDVPGFNVLPAEKVTIEMIDGGEVTSQRATDTRVEEYGGGWR